MKLKILLFTLITGMLSSCFEDNSNTEINPINPIYIEFGDLSDNISVYSMDTLRLNPIVYKAGTDDSDLSYEWVLTDSDGIPTVLGNTMQLNAEITVPASSNTYDLLLTVTEKSTGLKEYKSFTVTVKAPLGKGLLIADTKDEMTSDLNLVMSSNFTIASYETYSDKDTRIYYDIFSKYNGHAIDGLVNGIDAYVDRWGYGTPNLTVTTPQTIIRMHPHEYIVTMKDKECFAIAPEGEIIPQTLAYDVNSFTEFINANGLIYSRRATDFTYYYGVALNTPAYEEYNISRWCAQQVPNERAKPYFYDEVRNRFLTSEGDQTNFMYIVPETTTPFDPNNIGAKDALYMGPGSSMLYTLFKTEGADEYSLYVARAKNYDWEYRPMSILPFESSSNIQHAVAYASSAGEPVFYWATESAIYSLNTDSKKLETCLSVSDLDPDDPSAKITSIQIWGGETEDGTYGKIRVKDPTDYKGYSEKASRNNMMMVTLYNGTYGKVICVPIPNMGSGLLEKDRAFHRVYEGQDGNRFGRIVYLGVQDL